MLAWLDGRFRMPQANAPRERGQVLILFVIGMTVIFVIGAIVVDIGLWVSERRDVQAASDLAALAAATQLRNANPVDDAKAKGLEFAQRNGYTDGDGDVKVVVTPKFQGDPDLVEVTIDTSGKGIFSPIIIKNFAGVDLGARAVAKYSESGPGPGWVLFANSSGCNTNSPPLDIQANHLQVNGSSHSNGIIHIEGPQDDFLGPVTWVCSNGFDEASAQKNTGTYQPAPYPVASQPAIVPVGNWSDVPCTVTVPAGTQIENDTRLWDIPGSRLKSNVICSSGDLSLSGDGISGNVTFASELGKITITSSGSAGNQLQPADSLSGGPLADLLAVSFGQPAGGSAVTITATAGLYRGIIYAPDSQVTFDGSSELVGAIIADTILVSGNNLIMTALPSFSGPPTPPEIHLED